MLRKLAILTLLLGVGNLHAAGLLIPEEKKLPPLAMLSHQVKISIDDQVAVTEVEQVFRNHTERQLEATYVFPVPKGASVNEFTMLVGGKEIKGELVEAKKAREIYTSIVRRTQDPGLLEYMGNRLFRLRVFPIPPNGDQKVTLKYTSVAEREKELVQYVYPLKAEGKGTETLEKFSITAKIKSQHGVQNVYSPTHSISLLRQNEKEVTVTFDRDQGLLDKDFQLYYQFTDKDVGLTALTHRPISGEDGYFLMLISPKVNLSEKYQVPRDMVLVLDTSGSMRGEKMTQAKQALKYCLDNLSKKDRFAVINFATTVNQYRNQLTEVNNETVNDAKKWIEKLSATGGTAIGESLSTALSLRSDDKDRTFNIVFFTDGLPTIGETNAETILKSTLEKNSSNTRIFTMGVGNDVNATLLDQLAEQTRALTTYVRPEETIDTKVSSLFSKISHPVLANLKLTTTGDVGLSEVYPAQLPDLFHGTQLTVLGRYRGDGASAIKLTGTVGKETKEFVYEMTYPKHTEGEKDFVEHLWARRKVGYLLDQIRANGEKKELKEEVIALAKRYGITTPYTSYLIVPDGVNPVVRQNRARHVDPRFGALPGPTTAPPALDAPGAKAPAKVADFLRKTTASEEGGTGGGGLAKSRDELLKRESDRAKEANKDDKSSIGGGKAGKPKAEGWTKADEKKSTFELAEKLLRSRTYSDLREGELGVKLSLETAKLKNESRLSQTAVREINGQRLLNVGGVWIDEQYNKSKRETIVVKALSDAYFEILTQHPEMKKVFKLGNHLAWVTPSGKLLVIDLNDGKEKLTEKEITALFTAKK